MEQYIIELIKTNNRIIIPGFGAFLIAHERGYTVLFNNFLNFNDGMLATHISKNESITIEQANEKIEQYVAHIKDALINQGSYTIAQLGTFTSDANRNYHFEQNDFLNNEKNEQHPEPSSEIDVQADEDLLSIDQNVTNPITEELTEPVSNMHLSSNVLDDTLIELQPTIKRKQEIPENKTRNRKPMSNKLKEDKKKGSWLWILIPISLILIFAVYYFYLRDGNKKPVPTDQSAPTMIIDTLVQPAPPTEPDQDQPIKTISANKAFHIIVGSYKTPAQAEEFIQRLKTKGYNNATYFTRGNWYVVSIESLPTLPDAERVQEEILDRDRIESWIVDVK